MILHFNKRILSTIFLMVFFFISKAQNPFQLVNPPKNISLAKPFRIRIKTILHSEKTQIILPDSNASFYPFEWVAQQTTQDGKQWIHEYTFRCFVFEDSTQLILPIISINGKDSTHTTIKLPVYYIPKTLSTAEIQKGLYVEDRFLPMPVKTPYSLYAGVFVLLLASLALMYKMLKNPVKQWIKIKKLESKQKKWLIQAEQKIKNPDWIAAFVKHNKEYIEAHTNEKWTSLTPTELEKIQFPEIFQSIKDDFLKICQIEYEQDFSGKTAGPESKNLAMNILKKMRLIFELEKQQKRDL